LAEKTCLQSYEKRRKKAIEFVEHAWLVCFDPLHRALEGVHLFERMNPRVGDDAHRVRA
jgi:hypothetical protein